MPFLLNTMSSVAALTGDDLYLKNAPEKMLGRYLLLRIRYPYKFNTGTDGAAQAVLGAHKAELLDSALGKFDMKYGETESHAPYVGVSGSQLRRIHKLCTRREVNVGFSAGDAVVDLVVPFSLDALSDGRSRLPGWTQLRTMHLRYKEGAAFSETSAGQTVSRGDGKVRIDVTLFTAPSDMDKWSSILSFWQADPSDLECYGPEGKHLAIWDENAAAADTDYQDLTLKFGDTVFADSVDPYTLDDQYLDEWADGGVVIDDEVTPIYTPSENQSTEELPSGKPCIRQDKQYVDNIRARGLYWPEVDADEAKEATRLMATSAGEAVLTHTDDAAATAPIASVPTLPLVAKPASHPDFTLRPGMWTVPNSNTVSVAIPQPVADAATAKVSAAASAGADSAKAATTTALTALARTIPGTVASIGIKAAPTASTLQTTIANIAGPSSSAASAVKSLLGKLLAA